MKFFYINLLRRKNRNIHFLNECLKQNIPISQLHRFDAIDGLTHCFTDEELQLFKKSDFNKYEFKNKIMGNQLSHWYIFKEIIKNEYPVTVIFQDDAILRENFVEHLQNVIKNIPDDAEIVNIGFYKSAIQLNYQYWDLSSPEELPGTKINNFICKLEHGVNPCSLAYIITLKGAINMVNYFEKNGFLRATDGNFNDYLEERDIFYGSNVPLVSGNNLFQSDVFH
jgi:GR25 family glycosyltransferase involved in LPS biosynthesis